MDKHFTLSPKERELMEILWDAGEPLGRQEILDRAEAGSATWKPNSIHILINSMLDKGAVRVAGYYLNSRKLGRTFAPAVTKEQYAIMQVRKAPEEGAALLGDKPYWLVRCWQVLPEK